MSVPLDQTAIYCMLYVSYVRAAFSCDRDDAQAALDGVVRVADVLGVPPDVRAKYGEPDEHAIVLRFTRWAEGAFGQVKQ